LFKQTYQGVGACIVRRFGRAVLGAIIGRKPAAASPVLRRLRPPP